MEELKFRPSFVGESSINGYTVTVWDIKKQSHLEPFWPMYEVKFSPSGHGFNLQMMLQPIAWLELDRDMVLYYMACCVWDAYLDEVKKALYKRIDTKTHALFLPVQKRGLETSLWLQLREAALIMKLNRLKYINNETLPSKI